MFRAPLCSSSRESIVAIRYLVYVIVLYVGDRLVCGFGWNISIQTCIWMEHFHPNLHLDGTFLSKPAFGWNISIQTCTPDGHLYRVTYQMSYWYNWFCWWWVQGCSKHVENWNKYIRKKRTVRQVGCLQELNRDARSTEHKIIYDVVTRDTSSPPLIAAHEWAAVAAAICRTFAEPCQLPSILVPSLRVVEKAPLLFPERVLVKMDDALWYITTRAFNCLM
jgi:hypothetical protein